MRVPASDQWPSLGARPGQLTSGGRTALMLYLPPPFDLRYFFRCFLFFFSPCTFVHLCTPFAEQRMGNSESISNDMAICLLKDFEPNSDPQKPPPNYLSCVQPTLAEIRKHRQGTSRDEFDVNPRNWNNSWIKTHYLRALLPVSCSVRKYMS
ncbi:hypothetical protein BX600DRAFT_147228 [Xylariales sp. PMI_506]|nr:hypothetical protein BX600DRAFT_147228 [Xylariales sp. PMI_506]